MKEKTSVTLSHEVLAGIDRLAGSTKSRSAFIENILQQFIQAQQRAEIQARDLRRLNAGAERLNAEMEDVLDYQSSED